MILLEDLKIRSVVYEVTSSGDIQEQLVTEMTGKTIHFGYYHSFEYDDKDFERYVVEAVHKHHMKLEPLYLNKRRALSESLKIIAKRYDKKVLMAHSAIVAMNDCNNVYRNATKLLADEDLRLAKEKCLK